MSNEVKKKDISVVGGGVRKYDVSMNYNLFLKEIIQIQVLQECRCIELHNKNENNYHNKDYLQTRLKHASVFNFYVPI